MIDQDVVTIHWVETNKTGDLKLATDVWLRTKPFAMARVTRFGHFFRERGVFEEGRIMTSNALMPYVMIQDQPPGIATALSEEWAIVPRDLGDWERLESADGSADRQYRKSSIQGNFRVEKTITTDVDGRRLLRCVERHYELKNDTLVSEQVRDRYSYNEPIPRGTFAMPWWKPKRHIDMGKFRAEHMPEVTDEATKSQVRSTIERAMSAWQDGDWDRFAEEWQFAAYDNLPTEADWRVMFDDHAGDSGEWTIALREIHRSKNIGRSVSANSVQVSMLKEWIICAIVEVTVRWPNGNHWSGGVGFDLKPVDDGIRIVHVELPLAEIESNRDAVVE